MGKNISKDPDAKLVANISKAQSKFTKAFSKAEGKSGCETTGDVQQIEDKVDAFVVDTVGTVTHRFIDNGDGTVTHTATALMWEKKDQGGGLHDVDNHYTWAGTCSVGGAYCQPNAAAGAACSTQTGGAVGCTECSSGTCDVDPRSFGAITTIWDWLVQVSGEGGSGFAGYSDWRIPEMNVYGDTEELESILLEPYPCGFSPCIDGIFSPTAASWYWSSPTFAGFPIDAWFVGFYE